MIDIHRHIIEISENDNRASFKQFYLHFSPGMISYANSLLRNMPLAEEAVQDVFVKIWTNRYMLSTINNITHYLYVAVKHTAYNYIKNQRKNTFVDLEEASNIYCAQSSESDAVHEEKLRYIETAINNLPGKCRLVFRLVKENGLKYKEVAELLSLSPKTVEGHITFAYKRIATCLKENISDKTSFLKKSLKY